MRSLGSGVPPSLRSIEGGPIEIFSKNPEALEDVQRWIHDQDYECDSVKYLASERLLEIPFLCTVYGQPIEQWGSSLFARWWVPVVRGYLRIHNVRSYEIEDEGYAQIHDLEANRSDVEDRPWCFAVSGISRVSGTADDFEVSVEVLDRTIGWRRMTWVLFVESTGRLQFYDHAADDLVQRRTLQSSDPSL